MVSSAPRRVPYPGGQAGGEQRMPAEREEVVVDADALDAEDLREQGAQHLLALGARGPRRLCLDDGRGQRRAVQLAVDGQRQPFEEHEGRRQHVVGQPLPQVLAEGGGELAAAACGHRTGGVRQRVAGGAVGLVRLQDGAVAVPAPHEHRVHRVHRRRRRSDRDAVAQALPEQVQLLGVDAVGLLGEEAVGVGDGGAVVEGAGRCGLLGVRRLGTPRTPSRSGACRSRCAPIASASGPSARVSPKPSRVPPPGAVAAGVRCRTTS
ncbi:putative KtzH [Streptomyces alboflavus]|uniref:Putative KtzH n=1 Tax=Streptomyces alboflavus TaxID=67267 RepID=A0A1Z1WQZ9_9ACTN|nr:putative KtzH [Streptomyces alboflavus]